MKSFAAILLATSVTFLLAAGSFAQSTPEKVRGGVSLDLTDPPGSIYDDGEALRLKIRTGSDAYVAIFDIDTDGFVHLLYPVDERSFPRLAARRTYELPERRDEALVISGRTGMEFVFAVAAPNREDFDDNELRGLLQSESAPANRRERVTGDPFLAANDIASRLVRGITYKQGVSMAFTYFHVNEAVDYPRYMCEDCYETGADPFADDATRYLALWDLDDSDELAFPLERGFAEDVPVAQSSPAFGGPSSTTTVYVNYYPEWRTAYYPRAWWYCDPWYWWPPSHCYYPLYPYGSGFYFSVGWNWGCYGYYPRYYPYYYGASVYYAGTSSISHGIAYGTWRKSSAYRYKGASELQTAMNLPKYRTKSGGATPSAQPRIIRSRVKSSVEGAVARTTQPRTVAYNPFRSKTGQTTAAYQKTGLRSAYDRAFRNDRRVYSPRISTQVRPRSNPYYSRNTITRRTYGGVKRTLTGFATRPTPGTGPTNSGSTTVRPPTRSKPSVQPPARSSGSKTRGAVRSTAKSAAGKTRRK